MADGKLEQPEIDQMLHEEGLNVPSTPDATHKTPHQYTADERAQMINEQPRPGHHVIHGAVVHTEQAAVIPTTSEPIKIKP